MRHESGLQKLSSSIKLSDTSTKSIKENRIGIVFENETSCFPDRGEDDMTNNKAYYHAFTRDWLSNEIFRRVEPEGRTQGEYLKVVSKQFGFDIHIG